MGQDSLEAIKDAILNKKQVIATYAGLRREMCPHVLGYKSRRLQVLFYQFGGESKSGLQPLGSPQNWRCIPLDSLTIQEIRLGKWYSGWNYSWRQDCVETIVAAVDDSRLRTAKA